MTGRRLNVPCPQCGGIGTVFVEAANTTMGQRVRFARMSMGKSAHQLSMMTGGIVSASNIGNIERGQNTNPSSLVVRALAQALGVTSGYLMDGDEPPDPLA